MDLETSLDYAKDNIIGDKSFISNETIYSIDIDENKIDGDLIKYKAKKQDFEVFMKGNGLEEEVAVDKAWVEKKLKRIRLKIDKDIDLYINEEAYHDNSKFEIQRNGDGSINMIIKHVINYIEK